jgi:prepilin-type N-terminal cleavage/methylation domain-containing protein
MTRFDVSDTDYKLDILLMSRRAFTLVELLVVISIIGLLSTIAVVSMTSARSKARDGKRQADIKQIITAMQLYYDTNGRYPDASGALACNCGSSALGYCCLGYSNAATCHAGTGRGCAALNNALAPYMATIPDDPEHVPNTYGSAYLYLNQDSVGGSAAPAMHWGYDQVTNATNCFGGTFGAWGAGAGRNRYWCALTLRP